MHTTSRVKGWSSVEHNRRCSEQIIILPGGMSELMICHFDEGRTKCVRRRGEISLPVPIRDFSRQKAPFEMIYSLQVHEQPV